MSVTITSKSALSILCLAASPEVTVSTLSPSRRRAISRSSQMERSSSQTRMLPTRGSSCCRCCCFHSSSRGSRCRDREFEFFRGRCGRSSDGDAVRAVTLMRVHMLDTPQPDYKAGSLAELRARPHLALMRLHDLVDDGEAESGSALENRLERVKDFFRLLPIDTCAGVGEAHFPVAAALGQSHGQAAIFVRLFYGADGVFAEVPKHLFEPVAVGQYPGFGFREVALQLDARILGGEAVLEQSESVFQQGDQIYPLEAILFAAGVG